MKTKLFVLLLLVVSSRAQTGPFTATGNMTTPRENHTATLLFDGTVLIAGGDNYTNGAMEQPRMASAEIYDPVARTFTQVGDMTTGRSGHTATLLPDGRVLIAGGDGTTQSGSDPAIPGTAELYDPSIRSFATTGRMVTGRTGANATLLTNGKVLITGGIAGYENDNDNDTVFIGDAEIYDPSTGTFIPAAGYVGNLSSMVSSEWFDSTSTRLADGTVLFASESAAEIYDPVTGAFSLRGSMATRSGNYLLGRTASLLMDGKVLLAGGEQEDTGLYNNAELYDAATGVFSFTGAMTIPRYEHTSTLLPDGTVLIAGGITYTCVSPCLLGSGDFFGSEDNSELYDPLQGAFTAAGSMTQRRRSHTATLLNDGDVLVAGGDGWVYGASFGSSATAELYHPASPVPAPLLFSLSGDGRGQGAIWYTATGLLASSQNPAAVGEIVATYTTSLFEGGTIPPQVAIGGKLAEILYFGDAPGYPGYFQVNFRVQNGVAPGSGVPVRLTYLSRPGNAVTIGVQ